MQEGVKKAAWTLPVSVAVAFAFAFSFRSLTGYSPSDASVTMCFVLSAAVLWLAQSCHKRRSVDVGK
jgi:hypothetical protein